MWSRAKLIGSIYVFWLAFFLVARIEFLGYHWTEASALALGSLGRVFAAGLRLDLSAAAYLTLVPVLLIGLTGFRAALEPAKAGVWLWLVLATVAVALLGTADLELTSRWGRRIDAGVLPYLRTPREAWASTGASPRFLLIAILVGTVALGLWAGRRIVLRPLASLGAGRWWMLPATLAFLAPLVVAIRGGVQQWPLTVSSAYHSPVPFANLAAQNAPWGFFDSIYRRVYDRSNPFREVADSVARAILSEARRPVGERRAAPLGVPRPNVLIIVWESASGRAFGSLGGVPGVTPRVDSLARQGILFRRFYSAADRTDKGIAAILSGSPAVPRGSVVMVASKAASLPFLSRDLGGAGYATSFYYGGELEFASLRAYLTNAKFDRVLGKADFPRSSQRSKWGVQDGPVAERWLADLDREEEPFFSVWLTLSSHEPFETPDPVAIPGTDWQSRYFNSLRYTDRVIGDWIAAASARPWWGRTLVMIVADHGRRVLPLDVAAHPRSADANYRLPMLWLGGALTARDSVVDNILSQVDIASTLLSALGIDGASHYRFGRSLLQPTALDFAYYGFDEGFGVVTAGGSLVYDHRGRQVTDSTGRVGERERRLGAALLQLTYQDYLDR
jgi:hypothetical protein